MFPDFISRFTHTSAFLSCFNWLKRESLGSPSIGNSFEHLHLTLFELWILSFFILFYPLPADKNHKTGIKVVLHQKQTWFWDYCTPKQKSKFLKNPKLWQFPQTFLLLCARFSWHKQTTATGKVNYKVWKFSNMNRNSALVRDYLQGGLILFSNVTGIVRIWGRSSRMFEGVTENKHKFKSWTDRKSCFPSQQYNSVPTHSS